MMNASELPLQELAGLLMQRGMKITCAESCTGGWVAKVMTDLPGSSAWFERGFITYSNLAKQEMLGVSPLLLERHGAVSGETAAAMASGAIRNSDARVALAISGVAGPGGGSADKPVGTVWHAWAMGDATPVTACHHYAGDREAVRYQAVVTAVTEMVRQLGGG